MRRWLLVFLCGTGGALAVLLGLLVPAHLRAVDVAVLRRAGVGTPPIIQHGLAFVAEQNHGAADLVLTSIRNCRLPHVDKLEAGVNALLTNRENRLVAWGVPDSRLEALFWADPKLTNQVPQALTDVAVRLENRGKVLSYLKVSPRPVIQELLRTRDLTNTVVFPPASSASGQAYDTAICVCGFLLDRAHLSMKLTQEINSMAVTANEGRPEQLEEVLLAVLTLGQRMNFGQLSAFLARVDDADTLSLLAALAREREGDIPTLFSAVQLAADLKALSNYVRMNRPSAMADFARVVPLNSGAMKEMLQRQQRLHESPLQTWATRWLPVQGFVWEAAEYAWLLPWVALSLKWLLYLGGGFLLAAAAHFAWPKPGPLERPLQVKGFHLAREGLFALGFLLAVLTLSEPYLAQKPAQPEVRIRLRLPTAASIAPHSPNPVIKVSMMTQSLLTLLLFFVLQALLYTACLVKLAEIRRLQVPARMKLKLLDNEDHLFDAGLYLGFAGTIISLILVSMGITSFSLMAAYSSTSFGIIFVSTFKIFNLRTLRRRLLLEAESAESAAQMSESERWATQP